MPAKVCRIEHSPAAAFALLSFQTECVTPVQRARTTPIVLRRRSYINLTASGSPIASTALRFKNKLPRRFIVTCIRSVFDSTGPCAKSSQFHSIGVSLSSVASDRWRIVPCMTQNATIILQLWENPRGKRPAETRARSANSGDGSSSPTVTNHRGSICFLRR